jgi:hypothetical protein
MNESVFSDPRRVRGFIVIGIVLLVIWGFWLYDYNSPQKKLDRCISSEQKSGRWPEYAPMTMIIMCCQTRLHQPPMDHSYLTC